MSAADDIARRTRERQYVAATQRLVVNARAWLTRRDEPRLSRVGQLRFHEAHEVETSRMLFGGKDGIRITKPRKVMEEAKFWLDNTTYTPREAAKRIRKMAPADVRKLDSLDARIAKLQAERKQLVAESFERAIPVDVATLKRAAATNLAVAERGFPSNARKPRI